MIYISSACIDRLYINEIVNLLVENGVHNIELSGGTKYYERIWEDLQKLKKKYKLNYTCHAYFPPPKIDFVVNLASCNENIYSKSIRYYEECIESLLQINCNVLSIHAGFLIEIEPSKIGKDISPSVIYPKEESINRFCRAYKYLEKIALKSGIQIYLENNVINASNYLLFKKKNYLLMTDSQSILEMYERIKFNLLLDLGHLYVSCNTLKLDFDKEVKKLKKLIAWIHMSDNNGKRDEHKCFNEHSEILRMYEKHIDKDINVTIESKGDVSQVLSTYAVLENK